MSATLPDGAVPDIASAYGEAVGVSEISNAAEAVVTVASADGFAQGDLVEVTSGWSKLDGRIARIKAIAGVQVTLEGIDTSALKDFPVGGGSGSLRKITAWTQVNQVTNVGYSGGEQQYAKYSYLENPQERQLPTNKSAESMAFDLADDQTKPWYAVLDKADQDQTVRALRITLPNGAKLFYNGFVSFNKTPTLTKGQVMTLKMNYSMSAPVTRYAA